MENTSKNFVLQLGSLAALYATISAVIAVAFGVINIAFPDAAEGFWSYDAVQSSIRFGIAMLVVVFPLYLVLTRTVNQIRRREQGMYLTLTRWLIYLSLFVGGAVIAGDLIAVLWSFLNGEITIRFMLKAAVLAVIVGIAVAYYVYDLKGYWTKHEGRSKFYAAVAGSAVIAIIAAGFFHIDTPSEVRERRIDAQQTNDLQEMQYRIEESYRVNSVLPSSLEGLYTDNTLPQAPEGRADYEYIPTGAREYDLCATFAKETVRGGEFSIMAKPITIDPYAGNYNWDHEAGRHCFTRVVPENIEVMI